MLETPQGGGLLITIDLPGNPPGNTTTKQTSARKQAGDILNQVQVLAPIQTVWVIFNIMLHEVNILEPIIYLKCDRTTLNHYWGFDRPSDEQSHVLPLYFLDMTDDYRSVKGQYDKVHSGALDCLTSYPMQM